MYIIMSWRPEAGLDKNGDSYIIIRNTCTVYQNSISIHNQITQISPKYPWKTSIQYPVSPISVSRSTTRPNKHHQHRRISRRSSQCFHIRSLEHEGRQSGEENDRHGYGCQTFR